MGADMVIAQVDMGDGTPECVSELFDRWRARVPYTQFNDCCDVCETLEDLHSHLIDCISSLEEGWKGLRRDAAIIHVACDDGESPHVIMITGGMSWGDPPTDLYNAIAILERHCVFDSTTSEKIVTEYKLDKLNCKKT